MFLLTVPCRMFILEVNKLEAVSENHLGHSRPNQHEKMSMSLDFSKF